MKGRAALALAAVALLLSGCSATPPTTDAAHTIETELTVFAAASLRVAFDDMADAFTAEHPDVAVRAIYDGSSTVVTQVAEGAPADVVATADEANMQVLIEAGLARDPRPFATNTLVVVVPAGNPGQVTSLADLTDAVTVLCSPEVPCGRASQTLLTQQQVTVTAASLEQNVTAVRQKVAAGEADAGLVYATDVIEDDAVESFVPDGAAEVINTYPIAAVTSASSPAAGTGTGDAFVEFVLSDRGQQILRRHGFGAP